MCGLVDAMGPWTMTTPGAGTEAILEVRFDAVYCLRYRTTSFNCLSTNTFTLDHDAQGDCTNFLDISACICPETITVVPA